MRCGGDSAGASQGVVLQGGGNARFLDVGVSDVLLTCDADTDSC